MGRRRALVVATDAYADPGLRGLRSPSRDAAELAQVLSDPAMGDFEVTVVENRGVQALREVVESFFSTAERDDELLVHFSCHGLKDDANDLYLAATDTRPSLIASTGLAADFVARMMRTTRARSVTLFLDCCYGGAFERGLLARAGTDVPVRDAFGQEQVAPGSGRVVVTASSAVEYAFESGDLTESGVTPSVFTGALVEGIKTGEADSNGNGKISVAELFAYAEEQVRRVTPNQTPHMWSFGTHGDIVVARSPLRQVRPAALPAHVVEALAGDKIHQLGAVQVLRSLLRDEDPSVVLAARRALEALVGDDSRSLSTAATEALENDRLMAEPSSLEFGGVTAGTPGEPRSVVLGGSVLAVAARVVSHPPWCVVHHVGDRLDVTVRLPQPGEYAGEVVVSGPSGMVRLPVTATVLPAPASVEATPGAPVDALPAGAVGANAVPAQAVRVDAVRADAVPANAVKAEADAPGRPGPPSAALTPSDRPGRAGPGWVTWVPWLWVAAAVLQLLILFLRDGDGNVIISTVNDITGVLEVALFFGLEALLLVLAAARFRPAAGRWGLFAAVPGTSLVLAVFVLAATNPDVAGGSAILTGLAVSVLAVAGTVGAAIARRQAAADVRGRGRAGDPA